MADRFIDQDETQVYGPYAARKIRTRVVGLLPPFDPGLTYLADQIDTATTAVKAAIDAARDKDSTLRQGVSRKRPVLKQANSLLGRFSRHLDGHKAGQIDRRQFFTADGTAGGVGKSAPQVLMAVTHIAGKLSAADSPVRDRESWRAEFVDAMNALGPVVEHADDARTDRRELTPEVEAARQAWLQTYLAARSSVESVLRLTGKLGRMRAIFYDLAVSSTAKVTSIPEVEEPEEDDAADADAKDDEAPEAPKAP